MLDHKDLLNRIETLEKILIEMNQRFVFGSSNQNQVINEKLDKLQSYTDFRFAMINDVINMMKNQTKQEYIKDIESKRNDHLIDALKSIQRYIDDKIESLDDL